MKKLIGGALLAIGALLVAPVESHATVITFDFASGSGSQSAGTSTLTQNGIVASGFSDNPTLLAPATLWLRNQTGDHGLGVCSPGESCSSGGDFNELSQLTNNEAITLTDTNGGVWTSLWVSSLDSGGTGGNESGIIYWSTTGTPGSFTNSFSFSFLSFGGSAVEGNRFRCRRSPRYLTRLRST
jgi:hypothetical protein